MKYPPLPIMQCDPNCGECCGIAAMNEAEFVALNSYVSEHGLTPKRQGLTCPWYQGGTCVVHPVRPGICRLFGHTETLVCCKGYNVNIGTRLLREWNRKLMSPSPTRFTHEAFDDWKEMITVGLNESVLTPADELS